MAFGQPVRRPNPLRANRWLVHGKYARPSAARFGYAGLCSPFFPPFESGRDCLGPDLVDDVAELKLGFAQELRVGFRGEELSDPPLIVFGSLLKGLPGRSDWPRRFALG